MSGPVPTASTRSQFRSAVLANVPLCREHWRLVLGVKEFPPTQPGQFVQVACRELGVDYSPQDDLDWEPGRPSDPRGRELLSPLAVLRRPFSLAGRRNTPHGVELDIIHRVVGVGTHWLSRLRPGDPVDLLGPLGNRFTLPADDGPAILVGGGVGIPPMLYLAERLAGRPAVAFCGALSRDLLPLTILPDAPAPATDGVDPLSTIGEFARHGIPSVISTDDGTYGFRGFVTQALERYLDWGAGGESDAGPRGRGDAEKIGSRSASTRSGAAGGPPSAATDAETSQSSVLSPLSSLRTQHSALGTFHPPTLYTCGPEPMMRRVAEIAAERGLACQVAVERAMACGMGTCQSCVIRVRKPSNSLANPGKDWVYRLACTDGPIFAAADLRW